MALSTTGAHRAAQSRSHVGGKLHGRDEEVRRIDQLIEAACAGRSSALLLHGPPGIGKTALLNTAARRATASGLTVLRAGGVEIESELAFAALQQLLQPQMATIDALPPAQCQALRQALGLVAGPQPDRFMVSVAALGALASSAGAHGLVCVIDDVQWLDRPSWDALTFVARRLEAEGVGLILAGTSIADFPGVTELVVTGLDDDAALRVLGDRIGTPTSPAVAQRIVALADGNPLALAELPALLSSEQLGGQEPLIEPLPVRHQVEDAFRARIERLGEHARALLLIAAADDTGEWATIRLAALLIDVDPESVDDLEAAGLLSVNDGLVRFHQPLIRSVAYRSATSGQRRSAHLGLAEALETEKTADRRAWHLAAAATGPDERIADELERTAVRARLRAGHAAAATALERAAELTKDDRVRATRLVAAAEANWQAGRTARVTMLLDRAAPLISRPAERVVSAALRGRLELEHGDVAEAYRVLLAGARAGAAHDPTAAMEMLMRAAEAAWWSGRPEWAALLGDVAADIPTVEPGAEFLRDLLIGTSEMVDGDFHAGAAAVQQTLRLAETFAHPHYLLAAGDAAVYVGDHHAAMRYFERAVGILRAAGNVGELPVALQFLAGIDAWMGRFSAATVHATEGLRLAQETQQETSRGYLLGMLALVAGTCGRPVGCRQQAGEALEIAAARGLPMHGAVAHWALARLELASGNPDRALVHIAAVADPRSGVAHPTIALFSTPELVEAAALCGQVDAARAAVDRLAAWAERTGSPWSSATVAWLRGWLRGGAAGDDGFEHAATLHAHCELPFDEARMRLMYGIHLRQSSRDRRAREQLTLALARFESIGAMGWADRARRELARAGVLVRPHVGNAVDALTPQELQIAQAVARGETNKEIGAALFLSPRTIQYHLHKVFIKLGVSARGEVEGALDGH